jgi:hypothetical protein
MNLRELAALDHRAIVEDSIAGFGREIMLVSPAGLQATLVGFWNDIGQEIDVESGAAVSGRVASVRLANGAVRAAGFSLPRGIADSDSRPWIVSFKGMGGREHKFKIVEVRTDRSIDGVDCFLETYR